MSPDKLDAYARKYADVVNSNKKVDWEDLAPELSRRQIKNIRRYAREQGYVKPAPVDENGHADFTGHIYEHDGRFLDNEQLPQELWGVPKERQFRYLNNQLFETPETPDGWIWHHHQKPGQMQLVRLGIHGITEHIGGESIGGWSTYRH